LKGISRQARVNQTSYNVNDSLLFRNEVLVDRDNREEVAVIDTRLFPRPGEKNVKQGRMGYEMAVERNGADEWNE
jgi:hypothetical protein